MTTDPQHDAFTAFWRAREANSTVERLRIDAHKRKYELGRQVADD